jgi:hypothetical protein
MDRIFMVNLTYILTNEIVLESVPRGHVSLVLQICLIRLFQHHFLKFILITHNPVRKIQLMSILVLIGMKYFFF